MNLPRLLIVVVLGFAALLASDKAASYFSLSPLQKNVVTTVFFSPAVLVWIYLTYRPSLNFLNASPLTWAWRLLGFSFVAIGAFLFIGNRTGTYTTVPMAGSICLVIGVLIIGFFGRAKGQS